MKVKSILSTFTGLALIASVSAHASLVEVNPTSYSFDQATDTGSYQYHDWTGNQLTDGKYGTAPWYANLGNGPAYEWLGWVHDSTVNIDFDFSTSTLINQINIGTVQDHVNDVVFPSVTLSSSSDGISWTQFDYLSIPESPSNNNSYLTIEFDNLAVTDQFFRVSLEHSLNGPWTFVDEIDFYTEVAAVPEPSIFALMFIGVAGLGFSRRFKK